MKLKRKSVLILLAFLSMSHASFSQSARRRTDTQKELRQVIDQWYSSANTGDTATFKSLLTEDFQLLAFGKRSNKSGIMQMVKGFSDIQYQLKNVRSGSSGNLGFMTFDIKMDYKYKGNPDTGHAMETYLFRKENERWKVHTKVIVMIEAAK